MQLMWINAHRVSEKHQLNRNHTKQELYWMLYIKRMNDMMSSKEWRKKIGDLLPVLSIPQSRRPMWLLLLMRGIRRPLQSYGEGGWSEEKELTGGFPRHTLQLPTAALISLCSWDTHPKKIQAVAPNYLPSMEIVTMCFLNPPFRLAQRYLR